MTGMGIAFIGGPAPAANAPMPPGQKIFEQYCAACHGVGGDGQGVVSPTFKVPPPSLEWLAMSNGGTFPRERVRDIIVGRISMVPHGRRQMPVWGTELPAEGRDMQLLLDYLASVQRR